MNDLVRIDGQHLPHKAEVEGLLWTSYDQASPHGKMAIYRASLQADYSAEDLLAAQFAVEHLVIKTQDFVSDETGEVKTDFRVTLVSPDGDRATVTGGQVVRCLRDLVRLWGPPPWRPPLVVQLKEVKSHKGRRYYLLDLVAGPAGDLRPADQSGEGVSDGAGA